MKLAFIFIKPINLFLPNYTHQDSNQGLRSANMKKKAYLGLWLLESVTLMLTLAVANLPPESMALTLNL